MDGAVLILGFNAGARLSGAARVRAGALRDKLIDINERTGLRPEAVAKDVRANPEYARSVLEEPGATTYIFAKTVESAAEHMKAESPLSYLRQTQVEVVEVTPRFEGRNVRDIRATESPRIRETVSGDYVNEQTGEIMFFPKGGVRHADNSATRPGEQRLPGVSREHMEALENAPALLEKAVLGETHANYNKRVPNPVNRYYSMMKLGDEYYVVKLTTMKEPGKEAARVNIESVERVYDLYLTKKMPGSVMEAPQTPENPGGRKQPAPGITSAISDAPSAVNKHISLFHVLEGLKDSEDKKTPLFRPKNSQ